MIFRKRNGRAENIVDSGSWGGGTTWELVLSEEHPDPKLCTAVACVAISDIDTDEIALTRNVHSKKPPRMNQWEILAGHIDPLNPAKPDGAKETPLQALTREALEETGFVIHKASLFGYSRVHNAQPSSYPEIAYMPYYWAITNQELKTPTDPGQPRKRTFPIEAIRGFVDTGTMQQSELNIIEHGLRAAHEKLRPRNR